MCISCSCFINNIFSGIRIRTWILLNFFPHIAIATYVHVTVRGKRFRVRVQLNISQFINCITTKPTRRTVMKPPDYNNDNVLC